jgi:hypothetical protein
MVKLTEAKILKFTFMENLMVIQVEVIAPENPLDKNNPEQRL